MYLSWVYNAGNNESDLAPGVQTVTTVKPYDLQPGDRILGTDLIVAETHYETTVVADGQSYDGKAFWGSSGGWRVTLTNGHSLTYGADRSISVIRG
jgi:hypothetical protein